MGIDSQVGMASVAGVGKVDLAGGNGVSRGDSSDDGESFTAFAGN